MKRWLIGAVAIAVAIGSTPAAADSTAGGCIAVMDLEVVLGHAPSAAPLRAKLLARAKEQAGIVDPVADRELMAAILGEVQQAAESVRSKRGFLLIVDRKRAGVRGEDVTGEVQQRLEKPLPSRKPLPFRMPAPGSAGPTPCAAAVNMKVALDKVRHAYNAEHLLETEHDPARQEEVLRLLLEIQRDALKKELGLLHLVDLDTVIAASPETRDLTEMLRRTFMPRFGQLTRAEVVASTDPEAADSAACTKLTERLCLPGDPDVRACDAARALAQRTAALCEAATAPSLPAAEPRVERQQRPIEPDPCALLRQQACGEGRGDSQDCKQVRASLANMSAAGCTFTLKRRQATAP